MASWSRKSGSIGRIWLVLDSIFFEGWLWWQELVCSKLVECGISENKAVLLCLWRLVALVLPRSAGHSSILLVTRLSRWKMVVASRFGEAFFNKRAVSSAPPLKKLAGAQLQPVPPGSGRDGCGRRWEMARSDAPGFFLEASLCEVLQQWLVGAAALVGRGGHFAPQSLLVRFFFLQARVPKRRIFFYLSAALLVDLPPSGRVPGGGIGGRSIEVQRRCRRTRSLFQNSFRVLFRICEDYVVIIFYFEVLVVICTHRME